MEAKLQVRGSVTVVQVSGKLDIEKGQSFRQVCLRSLTDKKVVFCLDGLQFVGSSGIQGFFRALEEVHQRNPFGVKISGVNPDFRRLLNYAAGTGIEIHESVENALASHEVGGPKSQAVAVTPVDAIVPDQAEEA